MTSPAELELVWRRIEALSRRPRRRIQRRRVLGRRLRPAGVLVPFYRAGGRPHLLFTRRARHLAAHGGQIAFPGGAREDGDADLAETALRETFEELGIPARAVRLIGALDDTVSLQGFRVTPFAAEIPPPPVPQVNPHEVAEVIEVDVLRLMNEKIGGRGRSRWLGRLFGVHSYDYGGHTIWGLTGGIVHRLLRWIGSDDDRG